MKSLCDPLGAQSLTLCTKQIVRPLVDHHWLLLTLNGPPFIAELVLGTVGRKQGQKQGQGQETK